MIPRFDRLDAVGTVEIIGRSGFLERFGEFDGYFGTALADSRIVDLCKRLEGGCEGFDLGEGGGDGVEEVGEVLHLVRVVGCGLRCGCFKCGFTCASKKFQVLK